MHFLERIGDIFQEDQAEDDVLVLRRVHVVTELVGGQPELGFKAEVGTVAVFGICQRAMVLFPVYEIPACSRPATFKYLRRNRRGRRIRYGKGAKIKCQHKTQVRGSSIHVAFPWWLKHLGSTP